MLKLTNLKLTVHNCNLNFSLFLLVATLLGYQGQFFKNSIPSYGSSWTFKYRIAVFCVLRLTLSGISGRPCIYETGKTDFWTLWQDEFNKHSSPVIALIESMESLMSTIYDHNHCSDRVHSVPVSDWLWKDLKIIY